jgi:hypothetical protein
MKTLVTLTFSLVTLSSLLAQHQPEDALFLHEKRDSIPLEMSKNKAANIEQMATAEIQYFIITASENTFGYAIFVDGNIAIQQTTIPSLPGYIGFKNTNDAAKVAELAIKKMKDGEMPPTISELELIEMEINNRH